MTDTVDLAKPVHVTLEEDSSCLATVFTCDTIQEAEEWIADHGDREKVSAGLYGIDAPEGLADAYATGCNQTTEVPAEAERPLNHLSRLYDLLTRLHDVVDNQDRWPEGFRELSHEIKEAQDEIWCGDAYNDIPELREFDEIASQGREALIDWIENGRPEFNVAEPLRLSDEGHPTLQVPVPLSTKDAAAYLRKRAKETVGAIGFGPASFLLPGLQDIVWRLDYASKIPFPDDSELPDDGYASRVIAASAMPTADFYDNIANGTICLMPRKDLKLVAE